MMNFNDFMAGRNGTRKTHTVVCNLQRAAIRQSATGYQLFKGMFTI
jgi:hypothetical protein